MPTYTVGPVAGIPVTVSLNDNGVYATAEYQNVTIQGSPLIFYFDPPVQSINEISLPALIEFLADAIKRGAVITL